MGTGFGRNKIETGSHYSEKIANFAAPLQQRAILFTSYKPVP